MPRAYLKVRLDKDCGPGEYEVKIAKESVRIDDSGNLHLVYILAGPPRKKREPVDLSTTPAKTIKVKATGYRKRGY
jgi:propanediol utilization protein